MTIRQHLLADNDNLVLAARKILALGPKALIVKHGEYGATAFFGEEGDKISTPFRAPALPLDKVVDPTGAGDSFAGGFFGYLASQPKVTTQTFKHAMFYGGVMGSFAVERFGPERLMWGSDITRTGSLHTYAESTHYLREIDRFDADELAALYGQNLRRILRWEPDAYLEKLKIPNPEGVQS